MPSTPRRRVRTACARHHASLSGSVKSTIEPVPIHQRATCGSPSAPRTKRSRLVVGRRLAVQPARAGVGRDLAVEGLEVDPRRDPHDRAHADRAPARDHPGEVRELVRVGLPRVVLRLPGGVEHDRVERDAVPAAAVDVLLGVVLVRVDVARLPEAVAPRRQQRGQAGEAHVAAQAGDGRRVGEDVQAQRAGHAARRDPRRLVELEARAVGVGLAPQRVAAAGLQERRRRVVALRDAAELAQVGRAVGAGVGAIGAELHRAPGVVDAQRVARAEPGEALLRARVPLDGQAQRRALGRQLEHEVLGARELEAQLGAAAAVERQRDRRGALVGRRDGGRHRALGEAQALVGDHALGDLHEAVADLALARPHRQRAQQPAPGAAHVDAQRRERDLHAQGPVLEHEVAHALLLSTGGGGRGDQVVNESSAGRWRRCAARHRGRAPGARGRTVDRSVSCTTNRPLLAGLAPRTTADDVHSPNTPSSRALHRKHPFPGESAEAR